MTLREDAQRIIEAALDAAQPDSAVKKAMADIKPNPDGQLVLVAIGKAAWQMARAAHDTLGDAVSRGMVITKHGHSQGPIGELLIREAGHPVPDEHSYAATREALQMAKGLKPTDSVLLLVSGGGSSLFEDPLIDPVEMQAITDQLLKSGADIVEINTIRKRLSGVKGGRFALACEPAQVHAVVLSDIIGDPLDMIASGPAYPDTSTMDDVVRIVKKYGLQLSDNAQSCLRNETPAKLRNVHSQVTGSVSVLCKAAAEEAKKLGYAPTILTASLQCQAREAGSFLASIAQYHQDTDKSLCFIAGGETVVRVTGTGKGGRNQEIALSAAQGIAGLRDTAVFSLGSDGTDGPTDAAGGYADQDTAQQLGVLGINIHDALNDNNAYHALQPTDGLIITGPTGTNVNDVSVVLIKR